MAEKWQKIGNFAVWLGQFFFVFWLLSGTVTSIDANCLKKIFQRKLYRKLNTFHGRFTVVSRSFHGLFTFIRFFKIRDDKQFLILFPGKKDRQEIIPTKASRREKDDFRINLYETKYMDEKNQGRIHYRVNDAPEISVYFSTILIVISSLVVRL